ncbi:hypothetical protein ABZ832_25305 [Streptantibioticus parmotrematis]|uniref:hypothetical protein n=1 Tax=Streptantibioticus parmotrematis TaxID=2873249 RepID=UPI0033F1B57E
MSTPLQQPPAGDPFGAQPAPPQGYAAPQSGYGQPQQQAQGGYPAPAPAPYPPGGAFPPAFAVPQRPERFGLGLLAGLGAAVVAIVFYAAVLRFTNHEVGYVAIVVGLVVGAAMGKVGGGRSAALPVMAAVISLLAVWLGQLVGMAWTINHMDGIPFTNVLFTHFNDLVKAWKDSFVSPMDVLFFGIAGAEGFVIARRAAQAQR